jgi:predicted dehydrogenase
VAATPGLELRTVVTSNARRAAQAQREHEGVHVLPDVDSLWREPEGHDLVVVATANAAHVPLAREAVARGVAVVIDKPLATTAAEGAAVVAEAEAAGVPLTVFHNRRWDGDMLTLRQLISEGALGRVVTFESRFERWRPRVDENSWRERGTASEGGGLLLDLGTHLVDQALVLFGPPVRVHAEIRRLRPGAQVDDDFFLALEHRDGVRSHLSATMLAALPQARMRVIGLDATYVKDGLDVQEPALKRGMRPGDDGWGREPRESWGRLAAGEAVRRVETEPGAYERFYADVVRWLTAGGSPPVDPADAVTGLEIIEGARESARLGDVVELALNRKG